jgi:hypothetical protein
MFMKKLPWRVAIVIRGCQSRAVDAISPGIGMRRNLTKGFALRLKSINVAAVPGDGVALRMERVA